LQDDTEFAVIIQADEGQDPYAESTIEQANPGLGESIDRVWMRATASKARQTPSLRPAYFSRHLGWVITGTTPYIDADAWAKCTDTTLTLDDFEGEECWIALDLASKTDLVASAYVFVRPDDGTAPPGEGDSDVDPGVDEGDDEPAEGEDRPESVPPTHEHYYVIVRSYVNEVAVKDSKVSQYPGWAAEGHLTVTPGNVTDYDWVEGDIKEARDRFVVKEVAGDPWQAMQMLQHFQADGMPTVEFRPTYANLSEPTKTLEALVLGGRLHHNGDPVLAWAVSNVVLRRDGKDNVSPSKIHPDSPKKIDPVLALIMALGRALAAQASKSGYGSRGLRVLGLEDDTDAAEVDNTDDPDDASYPDDADDPDA
jgi:phage terminase large subunit-like protein